MVTREDINDEVNQSSNSMKNDLNLQQEIESLKNQLNDIKEHKQDLNKIK